jgi:cytochrome c2
MSRTASRILSRAAAIAALALTPLVAHAADAENGARLAQRWCASCHLVAPDQRTAMADVATFAAIARGQRLDSRPLEEFLAAPHPLMPGMELSREAIADLSAYIRSLK